MNPVPSHLHFCPLPFLQQKNTSKNFRRSKKKPLPAMQSPQNAWLIEDSTLHSNPGNVEIKFGY